MKSIQTSAIITGIRSKQDRSLGLSISTPELSIDEKAIFLELQGLNVTLVITPMDEPVVEDYKVVHDVDQKTPSQRLRGVLAVLWQQNNEGYDIFDNFYIHKMEYIINKMKEKLE